jgi:ribose transport system substrate-binding protein
MSWTIRRVTAGLIVGAMLTAGIAVFSASAPAKQKTYTLGFSTPIGANPALAAWRDVVKLQAKSYGMKVIVTDANFDPNKQLSDFNSLVSRKVSAILISPINPVAMRPAFDRARRAGIPVIAYEGGKGLGSSYATNFVGKNYQAARQAARLLGQKIGRGAKVAVIDGLPQIPILKDRANGFRLGAKEAGLDIVASQVNLKDNSDGARPIVEGWRTKFGGDLKGILSYNDPGALGAASVVGGSFKPVITGMNASNEGITGVRQGRVLATWDQRTVDVGSGQAWAAYQILVKHKKLPATINLTMPLFTKSNVSKWHSYKQLLSKPQKVELKKRKGETFLITSGRG